MSEGRAFLTSGWALVGTVLLAIAWPALLHELNGWVLPMGLVGIVLVAIGLGRRRGGVTPRRGLAVAGGIMLAGVAHVRHRREAVRRQPRYVRRAQGRVKVRSRS